MSGDDRTSIGTTIGVAAAVAGLTVALPLTTVAAPAVLAALVIEGSSTNPSGAGIEGFFGGKFADGQAPVYVNFLTGPFGIWRALAASADDHNTVISSGWGAANASLLISYANATNDPLLENTTWVLDNNVANPNGGFGTRYPIFAVIGVNPIPTPDDAGTTIISTAYEYDINGNAPKYILNPVADLNSLMAYFDRRLSQDGLQIPVNELGQPIDANGDPVDCDTGCKYTIEYDDGTVVRVEKVGDVTYVGYEKSELPLLKPLRDYGGETGDKLADAAEPALTAVVNWGYPDNDPLANPGNYEPAGLLPSAAENKRFVQDFVAGVKKGAATLTDDVRPNLRQRNIFRQQLDQEKEQPEAVDETPTRKLAPPKPKPISMKNAVEKLTKAFSPKRIGRSDDSPGSPAAE